MIRRATEQDVEQLAGLAVQLWPGHTAQELSCEFAGMMRVGTGGLFPRRGGRPAGWILPMPAPARLRRRNGEQSGGVFGGDFCGQRITGAGAWRSVCCSSASDGRLCRGAGICQRLRAGQRRQPAFSPSYGILRSQPGDLLYQAAARGLNTGAVPCQIRGQTDGVNERSRRGDGPARSLPKEFLRPADEMDAVQELPVLLPPGSG